MNKLYSILLVNVVALVTLNNSIAFDMNPIEVDCWGKDYLCNFTRASEKLKFPVHETMTLIAYDCYGKPDACKGGTANSSADDLKKSGRLRDLVLGSEWNDDPDSLIRQNIGGVTAWYVLFNDAKLQAECKNHSSPRCRGVKITSDPMMLYRSHFGDLQFFHSMASVDSETAIETKKKMMAWAKFTYNYFISEEKLDNKTIDSFGELYLIIKKGWTLGALFDPVPGGEWKKSSNPLKFGHYEPNGNPRMRNMDDGISVKFIALGSLLHMVQDSYSESHTAREFGCNPLARNKGRIITFRNYADQKGDDHAVADVYPEWLKHGELGINNPVWASAKIINFAFDEEPWEKVEKFLDTEVFVLSDPQAKPQPGDRDCFEGI